MSSFTSHIHDGDDPLAVLALADPEVAEKIKTELAQNKIAVNAPSVFPVICRLADDVISGLSLEHSLGLKLIKGYMTFLIADVDQERIIRYSDIVRQAAEDGATFAGMMATGLVPVLTFGDDDLLDTFLEVAALMRRKWFAAMTADPLEIMSHLMSRDDQRAGRAWLNFLRDLFTRDLTYNQYRRFSGRFPKAVLSFPHDRRAWRLQQMQRVVNYDFNLACVFIEALDNQLAFLSESALQTFVSEGLKRYRQDEGRGARFLEVSAQSAREMCDSLQTMAVFPHMRDRLSRYLRARCGRSVPVRSVSELPESLVPKNMVSGFDGRAVYLTETIDRRPDSCANEFLYKALAWIEAGVYEFGTFDFDFEKALALCGHDPKTVETAAENTLTTDLERFFQLFPDPALAARLFSIFEYGRIRTMLETVYPAGAHRFSNMLREAAETEMVGANDQGSAAAQDFHCLYARVVLGCDAARPVFPKDRLHAIQPLLALFEACTAGKETAEASALGVYRIFKENKSNLPLLADGDSRMSFPFHFQVRSDLFLRAFGQYQQYANDLKRRLAKHGVQAYKADIMKRLQEQGGVLSREDIRQITEAARENEGAADNHAPAWRLSAMDLSLPGVTDGPGASPADAHAGRTFRYREWDTGLGDYLADHVLVCEHDNAGGDTTFDHSTLAHRRGLAKKMRYAFELLKPEGLSILRRWREGEAFDYHQLLNFALDKKAGRTPSDRLYIKRIKNQRDVAVLLLIDFSRSTSNAVLGARDTTVMDIQKEAAVLFCEALTVVGDDFAIAGFSGTGRLGVDYFLIKDFTEQVTDGVRCRLGAAQPQRNTRMGAAIRHATARLEAVSARSKLLIIITDGFPNDVDYKREYALADTRRALLEARARKMSVHAITIDISENAALDTLYGKVSHSVISNVEQLPDKLLRIYGRLTA